MCTLQIQRNMFAVPPHPAVHPAAVGRLSERALREMVSDGYFSSGTRGTFAQFAQAYVDAWTHTTRSGQVRVNPLRPQVTVVTIQVPPELEAFMRLFPDTVYREMYTCSVARDLYDGYDMYSGYNGYESPF